MLTSEGTGRRKDCFSWGMDSRGGPYGFKRWPPPRESHDTLLHVELSSI